LRSSASGAAGATELSLHVAAMLFTVLTEDEETSHTAPNAARQASSHHIDVPPQSLGSQSLSRSLVYPDACTPRSHPYRQSALPSLYTISPSSSGRPRPAPPFANRPSRFGTHTFSAQHRTPAYHALCSSRALRCRPSPAKQRKHRRRPSSAGILCRSTSRLLPTIVHERSSRKLGLARVPLT